jgi:hypothetical protein
MLIVYGATAGVSVVKLYAGAFFPGLMLAGLYIIYVVIVAKVRPDLAPPLSAEARKVPLPAMTQSFARSGDQRALPGLMTALRGRRNADVPMGYILKQLFIALLPAILFAAVAISSYRTATAPLPIEAESGLQVMGDGSAEYAEPSEGGLAEPPSEDGGLAEPPIEGGLAEPPIEGGLAEPPSDLAEPPRRGNRRPVRHRAAGRIACSDRRARRTCRRRADSPIACGAGWRAAGGLDRLLDRPRRQRRSTARFLRPAQFPAPGDLQDAAVQLLPAAGADPGRAGVDRVRPGHADRSRRRGRIRRLAAGGCLQAAEHAGGEGVGLPDGQDQRYGVLAVRRQRPSSRRPLRCWAGRSWSRTG